MLATPTLVGAGQELPEQVAIPHQAPTLDPPSGEVPRSLSDPLPGLPTLTTPEDIHMPQLPNSPPPSLLRYLAPHPVRSSLRKPARPPRGAKALPPMSAPMRFLPASPPFTPRTAKATREWVSYRSTRTAKATRHWEWVSHRSRGEETLNSSSVCNSRPNILMPPPSHTWPLSWTSTPTLWATITSARIQGQQEAPRP